MDPHEALRLDEVDNLQRGFLLVGFDDDDDDDDDDG